MTIETVQSLATLVDGRVVGDGTTPIHGIADLRTATATDVGFVRDPRYAAFAASSRAGAVIVSEVLPGATPQIVVADVGIAFAKVAGRFFPPPRANEHSVHPTAAIDPTAVLEAPVRIGPHVSVGARSRIGAGTVVAAGSVVEDDVTIGRDCSIYSRVSIGARCRLGDRVVLHPGVVIGADGFGYAREGAAWLKVPQVGDVVLDDDVEIGANSTVDRGALGSTRLGRGTKIDNLVHIGHNVTFGADCAVAAFSAFAGSTQIGDRCTFAGHSLVNGHLKIGSDIRIGGGSAVYQDVAEPGDYMGHPLMGKREWFRTLAATVRLPDIHAWFRDARRNARS